MGQSEKSAVERRLARTVVTGRGVTFSFSDAGLPSVTAWIVGWDRFHWIVLDTNGDERILHKGSIAMLTLTDLYASGGAAPAGYEQAVGRFREYLIAQGYAPAHLLEDSSC